METGGYKRLQNKMFEEIKKNTGFNISDISTIIREYREQIAKTLYEGEEVSITGIVTLKIAKSNLKKNNLTGEDIKPFFTVKSVVSSVLKEKIRQKKVGG